MIQIRNLEKSFTSPSGVHKVLDGVSFDIPASSFTTIFGPNGCGKSTLVNIIAGLDRFDGGSISCNDGIKDTLGYVFQDYRRSLLPWYSVEENILFPLCLRGIKSKEARTKLDKVLSLTGLEIDLKRPVFSLSGGQAQAVCILRSLIINPKLLILDEPFAALDYERTVALRRVISSVSKSLNLTVLFISHDLEEAIALGDQVVFLSKGPTKVVEVLPVNLPYPRSIETTTSEEFLGIKQRAVKLFERCIGSG